MACDGRLHGVGCHTGGHGVTRPAAQGQQGNQQDEEPATHGAYATAVCCRFVDVHQAHRGRGFAVVAPMHGKMVPSVSVVSGVQNPPMRLVFAFLLCFAVVFQGSVAAHGFEPACAMGHDMGQSIPGSDIATGDCCNDAHTASETGQLCKTGQACSAPSAFAVTPLPVMLLAPASHYLVPTAGFPVLSFDPAGVWRPPSSS